VYLPTRVGEKSLTWIPGFLQDARYSSRHVHCSSFSCLETLFWRFQPKFEVKKCLAATYVLAAGFIEVR